MPDSTELPQYTADMFENAERECDIIMKGGITSGVVYPYAILELARKYRFHSIGGTSAGAIAAAFAAAAEYSRTVRGDAEGFVRLQLRCDTIPEILASLFQPAPLYRPLMRYLMRAQARGMGWLTGLPLAFPLTGSAGMLLVAVLMWLAGGGWPGAVLGAVVGFFLAIMVHTFWLVRFRLPRDGFGFCSGRRQKGFNGPALTDWLHASIQEIAFGAEAATKDPLTFGDLIGSDLSQPTIDLRMMATNLSMRTPHTLPSLNLKVAYCPEEWSPLFPDEVNSYLERHAEPGGHFRELKAFPDPACLPIVVAARMSLSFPILFRAIPAYTNDYATIATLKRNNGRAPAFLRSRIWFADGGISSNFPIHLFDALLPGRPTFALSLDELPKHADHKGERITIPRGAGDGAGIPVRPIEGVLAFAGSILGSAKDWQDQMLGTMPGQRERIARVYLDGEEGGLNLSMPKSRSEALMGYGQKVGARFANGALDFEEHRWRRVLVAYDQLENVTISTQSRWDVGGYRDWLAEYMTRTESYDKVSESDRENILERLTAFAALAAVFSPPVANKSKKFPRPSGRLKIGPDV